MFAETANIAELAEETRRSKWGEGIPIEEEEDNAGDNGDWLEIRVDELILLLA